MSRPTPLIALALSLLFTDAWAQSQLVEVSRHLGITHVHTASSLMGGGGAFVDYDNDGDLDLYLSGGERRDKLFENRGGTFTEVGAAAGLGATGSAVTMGVVTGDFDNDGYRDLFLTTMADHANILLHSNGDGTFSDISAEAGITQHALSTAATVADVNLDGWLDIFVTNYVRKARIRYDGGQAVGFAHECFPDHLYVNNRDGTFSERASEWGVDQDGCGLAVAFTDYDRDGDSDLYIANDFGEWVRPNVLFRNDGGRFVDVSREAGADAALYGMGIAIGDYDTDGDLDYYVTNLGRNVLLQSDGLGGFKDVTAEAGVENTFSGDAYATGWGTAFVDLDHDGLQDLLVSNGHIPALDFIRNAVADPNRVYRNLGGGQFEEVSDNIGFANTFYGRGLACGDYDGDGDVDILALVVAPPIRGDETIERQEAHSLLYRNDLEKQGNWLGLSLKGTVSNRDAIGSRVRLVAAGRSWIEEVSGGSSHVSQHSSELHFGLGDLQVLDSLIVDWPAGGRHIETRTPVNQHLTIVESATATSFEDHPATPELDLESVFPHPLRIEGYVRYALPRPGVVRITLYDLLGRQVATIADEAIPSGIHTARIGPDVLSTVAPGLYVLRLRAGGATRHAAVVIGS